jgi:HK97 gp10 family phage protein
MARVKVEGFKELDAALQSLKPATQKNVLRRVGRAALEPIGADMKARAPDDPTTTQNDLPSSTGVGSKLSKGEKRARQRLFRQGEFAKHAVELYVGAGPLLQAGFQEFGTSKFPPQPFARPAWEAGKGALIPAIGKGLWREIEKAAKRAARKAARLKR